MATLTKTTPALAGVVPTSNAAAAGGDQVANPKGKTMLRVANGSGGALTVTVAAQQTTRPADATFPAMTVASQAVSVGAGAVKYIGPIGPAFIDANGNTQLTYSGVTSLTVEAFDVD